MRQYIFDLTTRVIDGYQIEKSEAYPLLDAEGADITDLLAGANRIREHFADGDFDLCSIINAKSGSCPEDCSFCAQSAHYNTDIPEYPLLSPDEIVSAARKAECYGSQRFCIVTSGTAVNDADFEQILFTVGRLRAETGLQVDCSLGALTDERVKRLQEAGVSEYNHNIETDSAFYETIVTTHHYSTRVDTVKSLKTSTMEVCSGGIIGLGETARHRIDMAFTLRELGVDCVPINILNPRPGTPLHAAGPLSPMEVIKTIAIYRFILPKRVIKVAGGREANLRDLQALAFLAGANGMIIGGYLTTKGRSADDDIRMLEDLGINVKNGSAHAKSCGH